MLVACQSAALRREEAASRWLLAAKPVPDLLYEESRELALLAAWATLEGDDVQAQRYYRRAVQVDPQSHYLWTRYAESCERTGATQEAARARARLQALPVEGQPDVVETSSRPTPADPR